LKNELLNFCLVFIKNHINTSRQLVATDQIEFNYKEITVAKSLNYSQLPEWLETNRLFRIIIHLA